MNQGDSRGRQIGLRGDPRNESLELRLFIRLHELCADGSQSQCLGLAQLRNERENDRGPQSQSTQHTPNVSVHSTPDGDCDRKRLAGQVNQPDEGEGDEHSRGEP